MTRTTQLCKKNIYGVIYEDGLLYTVSQDKTIKIVDVATFEELRVAKNAVVGMVDIVGIYNDTLIVMGERIPLSFWDKKTLQPRESVEFTRNRKTILSGGKLFGCDNQGVYSAELSFIDKYNSGSEMLTISEVNR